MPAYSLADPRVPLELARHAPYERGIMPEQMSYAGRNVDIVTGITAHVRGVRLASGGDGTGRLAGHMVVFRALAVPKQKRPAPESGAGPRASLNPF